MKKILIVIAVILCLSLLASCGGGGEDPTTTAPTTESTTETTTEPVTQSESEKALVEFQKYMKDEGYLCGVAYLGYYSEDIGVIIEDLQYKGIYDEHKFLSEIKRKDFHSLEGCEFYAVVPAEGVKVKVNEHSFNEEGIGYTVRELVNITDGTPVFVRGNVSDIMANIQLIITDDNGYEMDYLPSMSLENGLLSKGQQIYDFSPYQLIGGHFENINSEDAPAFVGTWWGVYTEADGNDLSLNLSLKENGEAEYSYGYGNSEIFEQFSGSWYKDGEEKINLIMYGGPCSSDGAEAETSALYEFDGIFSWCYNEDSGKLELTHESGNRLLYGTDGQTFVFESLV